MKEKELILSYVDKNKDYSVNFLRDLIRFDSQVKEQGVDGSELKIQKFIEKKFLTMKADRIDIFEPDNGLLKAYKNDYTANHNYKNRPNVVGIFNFNSGKGKSIILNGHSDTVPPAGGSKSWSFDPWDPVIKDNKIYGLGSTDMKAGLASIILATEFLKKLDLIKKGQIIIESVVDEEGGGNGTLSCINKGYKSDIAIIAEPTGLQMHVAHRGVQLLEVVVSGLSVHAANKWKGENAIEKAIKIVEDLRELERRWLATKICNYVPRPTITVGVINGGLGATIVPDKCLLKFDVKMVAADLDEENGASLIRKEVEDCIYRTCSGDEWLSKNKPILNWYCDVTAYENKELSGFKKFFKNCEEILGNCIISGCSGGSDARILGNFGKIPTILFGPGDFSSLGGPHSVDENVKIDEYINHLKIMMISIYEFLNE